MIFPTFLKPGGLIGVTACSDGKSDAVDQVRLDNAKKEFLSRGFNVTETPNTRKSEKGRSSEAVTRAHELIDLVVNPDVKAVMIVSGGDYLGEMLPYLDLGRITRYVKWYQGYSDPTGLLYCITTKCDIATVYSQNYAEFGMDPWHKSLEDNLSILCGKNVVQESFDRYQANFSERITGLEGFETDTPVRWYGARGEDSLSVRGRLIGGCLDVLLDLIGTPYENTLDFIEKYKNDGILWYLESFALDSERLTMALWHLREAGWFKYAKGFVFGRPCFFSTNTDTAYEEAVLNALDELDVPIICGADIGHRKPSFTVVNGVVGEFTLDNGKGTLKMEFRERPTL